LRVKHPKWDGHDVEYVVVSPMVIGSSDGCTREVKPGDLLTEDEVQHSRGALARMIHTHRLAVVHARGDSRTNNSRSDEVIAALLSRTQMLELRLAIAKMTLAEKAAMLVEAVKADPQAAVHAAAHGLLGEDRQQAVWAFFTDEQLLAEWERRESSIIPVGGEEETS
jgi:hypothetical protein